MVSAPSGSARSGADSTLVKRTGVFDADDLRRAHTRIAHEILERNRGADNVGLVGLFTPGLAIAHRLGRLLAGVGHGPCSFGGGYVSLYRVGIRPLAVSPSRP